jgi:hypothetical protein
MIYLLKERRRRSSPKDPCHQGVWYDHRQMPAQTFQCPFCEKTSSAPQGLSAHIRNNHKKQYGKWSKNPDRLEVAKSKSPAQPEPVLEPPITAPIPEASPVHELAPSIVDGNGTLELLNQARQRLADRKHEIEAQLAQMESLRAELEKMNTQIESLDGTLKVFSSK